MSQAPQLSIVIPARNEQCELGATLESVRAAADALGQPWECIVVDDGSTDRTAEIARALGARVIAVELHNIGAVRNAGAREARGRRLVFLDADTRLPAETLQAAWDAMDSGAVGGGAWVRFDGIGWFARILIWMFCFGWQRLCGWAAGCFIFANKAEFDAVGGFDETYFASEERFLSTALCSRGRFVILKQAVTSSPRKLRLYTPGQILGIIVRALLGGRQALQRREGLEFLYDAPRETG
ncbi:MAG: glycosyltransferase [Planctomycetaceae bacterium]